MSELIPNLQYSKFKSLLKRGVTFKACEVFEGTKYKGTFIPDNPLDSVVANAIRLRAEALAVTANSVLPVPEEKESSLYDKRVAAMAHARKARKVAVGA